MGFRKFFIFAVMDDSYFRGETQKRRGTMLLAALVLMLLSAFMGMGIDVDQYLQHREIKIPGWYFYLIFAVDVIIFVAALLIYLYRKVGVFLFPVGMLMHFFFHLYFLNTFVYSDLLAIFFYSSLCLLAVIPQWKFFR